MNNEQYDMQRRAAGNSAIASLSYNKLSDRQAARADYAELLRDTEHLSGLVDMLISGDYGYDYYLICQDIINASKRRNRVAALSIVLGAVECGCPAIMARQAYLTLTPDEQGAADRVFETALHTS